MSALNPMDDAVSRAINGHDAVEDLGSTTSLINRDLIRYARHIVLPGFGQEAQRRLRDSRVLVVGAGASAPRYCYTCPPPGLATSRSLMTTSLTSPTCSGK